MCYANGEGVTKDESEAVKWYRKAAAQGLVEAQRKLEASCVDDQDVAKGESNSIRRYQIAAEQGDANAQYNLGEIYRKGLGVEKNMNEAVKWYRKAAEQGNMAAQVALSVYAPEKESHFGINELLVLFICGLIILAIFAVKYCKESIENESDIVRHKPTVIREDTPLEVANDYKSRKIVTSNAMGLSKSVRVILSLLACFCIYIINITIDDFLLSIFGNGIVFIAFPMMILIMVVTWRAIMRKREKE